MASMTIDGRNKDKVNSDDFEKQYFNSERSPIWSGSDKGWQLTWGIWHRLPRDEQKKIAIQHGLKSIGEFEEFVSLQQAVDDSEYSMVEVAKDPSSGTTTYSRSAASSTNDLLNNNNTDQTEKIEGDEQEESDDDDDHNLLENECAESETELSEEELMMFGGKILILPSEILHQIFAWLPADAYGTLALAVLIGSFSREQKPYINDSARGCISIRVSDGNCMFLVLEDPIEECLKHAQGFGPPAILKYSKFRKVERDMWCEIPIGAVLETVYYRYLYFHEDGRCLYALSNSPPKIMFPRMLNVILHKEGTDPAIVSGIFQIQKYNCTVIAKQPWHSVKFEITIIPDSIHGRFAALTIDRHLTSVSG
eukprot:CAMPEP_0168205702 /NCGR_PEP_ID=MMETSP0140_2-20121125/524_1 /TAXON_ID=44445 /ORGANISM="Pseudo-nitzschia australis, Strain 10249 10 AB" /LENGTH=365 /DNA_ID=CAMNT_0008131747 /DNA_START=174 /DNA_END=1269 /DNA_ORIENTATION=-